MAAQGGLRQARGKAPQVGLHSAPSRRLRREDFASLRQVRARRCAKIANANSGLTKSRLTQSFLRSLPAKLSCEALLTKSRLTKSRLTKSRLTQSFLRSAARSLHSDCASNAAFESSIDGRNFAFTFTFAACSKVWPAASNLSSDHGAPMNEMPIGSPCRSPIGTVRCG